MKPDKIMMHGSDYAGQDPVGWIVTEKFDGFFARWTGTRLLTREGANYNPPDWFVAGLPPWPIDCELFAGYGKRGSLNGAPRWRDKMRWAGLRLIAFDAPTASGGYANRHDWLCRLITESPWIRLVNRWTCTGKGDVVQALEVVLRKGGEGLVIRDPQALYTIGRVQTMLKVKPEFLH